MQDHAFQLVFQFLVRSREEVDSLIALMHSIEDELVDETGVLVDGFDVGQGKLNIFIHTNELQPTFKKTGSFIHRTRPGLAFMVGYRAFTEDFYTPLFPPDAKTFSPL
jgi:hypothetical protein